MPLPDLRHAAFRQPVSDLSTLPAWALKGARGVESSRAIESLHEPWSAGGCPGLIRTGHAASGAPGPSIPTQALTTPYVTDSRTHACRID